VEKSDCIIVLAPRNPEAHERLADIPLMSEKPVYVDKTFAPDIESAKRMFERAEKYNTPMFSTSALRFGSGLNKILAELDGPALFASAKGGGSSFSEYAIHQIEILVMLMGSDPVRIMQCGVPGAEIMVVEYSDGRRCVANYASGFDFAVDCVATDRRCFADSQMTDFFARFVDALLEFFSTGKPPVPKEQTLAVSTILETGIKALSKRDEWFVCK
jgi:hypothetical protein